MSSQPALDLSRVFTLEPHGPDTYVAESPQYPWGRIYGGLVIAQALWAATQTVRVEHVVHSLHAYFILGGEFDEPVRYEVDRTRNGRSFSTRRVVARQSAGAILTLECSFQRYEEGAESQSHSMPAGMPDPDALLPVYDAGLDRREVPHRGGHPGAQDEARLGPLQLGDRLGESGRRRVVDPAVGITGLGPQQDGVELVRVARGERRGLVDRDARRVLVDARRARRGTDRTGGEAGHGPDATPDPGWDSLRRPGQARQRP